MPLLDSFKRSVLRVIVAGLLLPALVSWGAPDGERLLNLSSRALVGSGADVMIAGFVIEPGPEKEVLVRAIGPALGEYGVQNPVQDPVLQIVDANGRMIASNVGWPEVLAEKFAEVGAFALGPGSADAALVAKLAPGAYTAVARSAQDDTWGNALIEIYDLAGVARLSNLSTRANVQANDSLVISGLVIAPGSEARRLLLRAVGPTLGDFGVPTPLGDPAIALVRQSDAVQIATNDNWSDFGGAGSLAASFSEAGAFALPEGSKDAALLMELPSGAYTVMVNGANGTAGTTLVEVYDLTPTEGATVSLAATVGSASTAPGSAPGQIRVLRVGSSDEELQVNLAYGGTAAMGTDYVFAPGTVTLPAGVSAVNVAIVPYANTSVRTFNKNVLVSVESGDGYEVGLEPIAEVRLFYSAGTLYLANLLPTTPTSNAYGTVTLQLASDESSVLISSHIANLSSPQTAAYIRMGAPGEGGEFLFALPNGQSTNVRWDIQPVGTLSEADILQALQEGRIHVSVGTTTFPTGELVGTAARYAGSHVFEAPPAISQLAPAAPATEAEAARFLTQTTFGPTKEAINGLMSQTYLEWIDAQIALPASSHRAETVAELERWGDPNFAGRPDAAHRHGAYWKLSRVGEDQLRQRVALALSEILVVSEVNGSIYNWQEGAAHYHDMLGQHAFGNFRDLLENMTLHPIMGVYLSHLRNAKADPETGSVPDENFAREIMQLFSIGLVELHPDGSLRLDGNGLPIPTYDQDTITETARVFTGWAFYHEEALEDWRFRWADADYINPMMNYPQFHDDGAKTIVTGRVLPAGQGALKDLTDTLDTLFEHANTGPFIVRRLIQRLVTSNPTPGYIHRVSQAFANNGSGERGDLEAVVKAILLDPEARNLTLAASPNFGKIKEPMIRMIGLWRAFKGEPPTGQIRYFWSQTDLAQGPLRAPSVFNFFTPDYVAVGDLAAAGLFAPELQIHTDSTAMSVPNRLSVYAFSNFSANPSDSLDQVILDIAHLVPLMETPAVVLEELNLLLCSGSMSEGAKARFLQAEADLPSWMSPQQRISSLIYLVVTSPAAAVQN